MSETVLTIDDAAHCLTELAERVHSGAETALLTKEGKPFVRIVAAAAAETPANDLIAFLRHWRLEHPDPDEQFAQAIQEGRRAMQPPHDPWE